MSNYTSYQSTMELTHGLHSPIMFVGVGR